MEDQLLLWFVIIVGVIGLLVIGGIVWFGLLLHRWHRFLIDVIHEYVHMRPLDATIVSNVFEESLTRRNEFWTLFGQFVLSALVIVSITILLLTKTISAEAGLPILAGVGGFAIGKGISMGRIMMTRRPEREG